MLQFIHIRKRNEAMSKHLKTSHVTVYRYGSLTAKGIAQHLKTSHVTVYLSGGRFICLGSTDLKTSHVTVYPNPWDLLQPQDAFKNISCYSLSTTKKQYNIKYHYLKTSHVTVYRFFPFFPQVTESDLKTSHVTVYRRYFRRKDMLKWHLKTSHVTVYPLVFTPFFLSYLIFSLILSHFHFFYQVFFTSATLS